MEISEQRPDPYTVIVTVTGVNNYEDDRAERARVLALIDPLLAALPPPRERSVEQDEAAGVVRFVSRF